LRSLEVERSSLVEQGELIEGVLRCTGCARRYPVLGGAPVVMRDLGAFLGSGALSLLSREVDPDVLAVLAAAGVDEAPIAHETALLSSYLDASWGDRAAPPPDGPGAGVGASALVRKVAERAERRVQRALELGCGVGRALAALAPGADLCVGLDASPWALRAARRLLGGRELLYARRSSGRHYARASVSPGDATAPGAQFLCADALAPPLAPGTFDRVAALNLLDAVHSPALLLDVLAGLLAPGGELLLAAPYAWSSAITVEAERWGPDPAESLRAALRSRGLRIEDEELRVPWVLRRDERAASLYEAHWVRASKPG
jgi:SAM-dependent methyltransferase